MKAIAFHIYTASFFKWKDIPHTHTHTVFLFKVGLQLSVKQSLGANYIWVSKPSKNLNIKSVRAIVSELSDF